MNSAALDISSPLSAALHVFNLLPSHTLHPERAIVLWPEDAAHADVVAHTDVQRALHRQRSTQLLHTLGEDAQTVNDVTSDALPLALAEPALLQSLTQMSGVLLLGGMLRRTIARGHLAEAKKALGETAFQWARNDAAALHPGLDDAQVQSWFDGDLNRTVQTLGAGFIANAWQDAPAHVRLRADWKLAPSSDTHESRSASGLPPRAARDVCLTLMQQLDSTWLSYFPKTH